MSGYLHHKVCKRIFTLSVLPVALLAAAGQAQDADASRWASGKNLYDKVCGHCHAPEVGVGPAIGGRDLPEAYIKVFVRNGINAMPSFPASFIDDESIARVTEYLATLPLAPVDQP